MQPAFRLHVRIDKTERLLGELAIHAVDLVIADAPIMPSLRVRAFNHLLGETSVSIFGTAGLARTVRKDFPKSLHGAPMLLQTTNTAMLQTLGEHGLGLFAAPSVVHKEVCRRYNVVRVGELPRMRERFYAISVERRITHPAVRLIADQAKRRLFP
jgi:LysR family transcriptional regulator, transcriptional activator of nhaA